MKVLKGKLEYISLFRPIKLFTDDGEIDLRDIYFKLLSDLNGKRTNMVYTMNSISIFADETSNRIVEFKNDGESMSLLLTEADGSFGFTNIGCYLPEILQRLNGMMVVLTILDDNITIAHDVTEKVFELNYTSNNSCSVSNEDVKTICKIGEKDCCIFISAGGSGFECQKFDAYFAHNLLCRLDNNELNATRIGNCKIIGRKEIK